MNYNFQIDLNRDFPSWDDIEAPMEELSQGRAPETIAIMKHIVVKLIEISKMISIATNSLLV